MPAKRSESPDWLEWSGEGQGVLDEVWKEGKGKWKTREALEGAARYGSLGRSGKPFKGLRVPPPFPIPYQTADPQIFQAFPDLRTNLLKRSVTLQTEA